MADIKGLQSKALSGSPEGEGRQSSEIREGFPPTSRLPHAYLTPTSPPTQGKRSPFLRSCITSNAKWHNIILSISLISLTFLFSCTKLKFDNPYDPKNRPPGPQASSPADGAIITDNPPQFSWADCGVDTAYYHLQISTDSLFSTTIFDDNDLHGTAIGLSFALPYGQLYWRVRAAKAKDAWGPWSPFHNFFCKYGPVCNIYSDKYYYETHLSGFYLYLRTSHGFDTYDITIPSIPRWVSSFKGAPCDFLDIREGFLYGLNGQSGSDLTIVDVSNPASPHFVAFYPCSMSVFSMALSGSNLYLTGGVNRDGDNYIILKILDLSTAPNLHVIGEWDTLAHNDPFHSVAAERGWAYAFLIDTLMIFDCRDPRTLRHVVNFQLYGDKIYIHNNYLFVPFQASAEATVSVINVSDPLNPKTEGFFSTPYEEFAFQGNLLVNAGHVLLIYDIASPTNPTLVGSVRLTDYKYISISEDYAYLSGYDGLTVVRVR